MTDAPPSPACPAKQPPRQKVAPAMSWRLRLSLLVAGYITDATRRADGTLNRRLLSLLDPRVPASASPRRGVASRDVELDPSVPLGARLFYPCPADPAIPLPVIVFFHGGGFAYLSAASFSYDGACRRICRYAGAAVLSVDYRRSPEQRFPAPYDDGFSALRFLDDPDAAKSLPVAVDPTRCFLAGDSAGANIAHHVARRYAAAAETFRSLRILGLVAIQPFFGGEERTDAELRLDGAPIVNTARTDWMWRAFLPPGANRTHEAASPEAAAAASGVESAAFPPVVLVIGGYDPLQDWQRRYGEALKSKGKRVEVVDYPDAIHAFYVLPEFEESRKLMVRIKEFVKQPRC